MDTSDTQAEAVKRDVGRIRDHLRAAAVLLKRLNETGQGSDDLVEAVKGINAVLMVVKNHGSDASWSE